jgi:hypothetical protein
MNYRGVLHALATALAATAAGCSSSPAAPQGPPAVSLPINLAGAWSGTGSDAKGAERLSWTLTQAGSDVAGPVQMTPLNQDGSCASCHKLKKGTVAGTLSGTKLMLKLSFPAGGDDVTPLCSFLMDAEAADVTTNQITGTYRVEDTCEGRFSGTFVLSR